MVSHAHGQGYADSHFIIPETINYIDFGTGPYFENIFNAKWNEAQFATESRLKNEPEAITELNFTPGIPFFIRAKFAVFF